ncbi:Imm1 family immunity protein [Actinoplanes missouriensis]|uniref:Imm1 family immunity protein n=1 Tax=Actinoplanes missouriensis TaxID=1866 RepID=UPI0033EA0843
MMITYRVAAQYLLEHVDNPLILTTAPEVDELIDALQRSSAGCNLAQLHSLDRSVLPSGSPDHELLVGVDGGRGVGVLAFMDDGNWTTLGDDIGRDEVGYSIVGHLTEFPERSEIPLDLLREAVKEFCASGGRRPACVNWQLPGCW